MNIGKNILVSTTNNSDHKEIEFTMITLFSICFKSALLCLCAFLPFTIESSLNDGQGEYNNA